MDKNKKLFPQRLWELIHDEKYNFCLRWSTDGQRVYLNRNEFEQHYLKTPNNQFHTQKAISFVRQMNMYGFKKVDDCYYENDNFKRNCPHLLQNMIRRNSNKTSTHGLGIGGTSLDSENDPNFNSSHSSPDSISLMNPVVRTYEYNHSRDARIQSHNLQDNYQYEQNLRQQLASQIELLQANRSPTIPQQGSPTDMSLLTQQEALFASALSASTATNQDANFFNALGAISAVLAAVNSGVNSSQLPLNSTLHHRLEALNLSPTGPMSNANENSITQRAIQRQRDCESSQTSALNSNLTFDTSNASMTHIPTEQTQQNFNIADIPFNANQSTELRQALQQSLMRSLLQFKQNPQYPSG